MITPNPIFGTGLHAIGGISAASCYMPFEKVKQWSWGTFWLVQSLFAWLLMPLIIDYFTVPDLFTVLEKSPASAFWPALLLGATYGFGGLSFGYAIRNIGYSLTYTISIGISAVLGTIIPLVLIRTTSRAILQSRRRHHAVWYDCFGTRSCFVWKSRLFKREISI